jgi:hypothetical protein
MTHPGPGAARPAAAACRPLDAAAAPAGGVATSRASAAWPAAWRRRNLRPALPRDLPRWDSAAAAAAAAARLAPPPAGARPRGAAARRPPPWRAARGRRPAPRRARWHPCPALCGCGVGGGRARVSVGVGACCTAARRQPGQSARPRDAAARPRDGALPPSRHRAQHLKSRSACNRGPCGALRRPRPAPRDGATGVGTWRRCASIYAHSPFEAFKNTRYNGTSVAHSPSSTMAAPPGPPPLSRNQPGPRRLPPGARRRPAAISKASAGASGSA